MGIQNDPPKSLYAAPGDLADENVRIRDQLPPETDQHGYHIREQPMGTKKRVKVILMGAGASSLNFFKKAEEEMENLDIVCYEKNADIGGTWLENRYYFYSTYIHLVLITTDHLQGMFELWKLPYICVYLPVTLISPSTQDAHVIYRPSTTNSPGRSSSGPTTTPTPPRSGRTSNPSSAKTTSSPNTSSCATRSST